MRRVDTDPRNEPHLENRKLGSSPNRISGEEQSRAHGISADIHRHPRGTKMPVHSVGSEDTIGPDAL